MNRGIVVSLITSSIALAITVVVAVVATSYMIASSTSPIDTSRLNTGEPNQVVITTSEGAFSGQDHLTGDRGGTGTDSSTATGLAHLDNGAWTYSSLKDVDVASDAEIQRNKLAAGTAGSVVINDGNGRMTDQAKLSVALGGTGISTAGLSGIPKVVSGNWQVTCLRETDFCTGQNTTGGSQENSANSVVVTDSSGFITTSKNLSVALGGTGRSSAGQTGIAKVNSGAWSFSPLLDSDVSDNANISRLKIATGPANQVLINDNNGNVNSIPILFTELGGTGISTASSSGIPRISIGHWSVGKLFNNDIDSTAEIQRIKLATGNPNYVVVNDVDGFMSEAQWLSASAGGTGIDTHLSNGVAKVSAVSHPSVLFPFF
jgi:hypothetical protein